MTRRNIEVLIAVLVLGCGAAAYLFLYHRKPPVVASLPATPAAPIAAVLARPPPPAPKPPEVKTATFTAPQSVSAGAAFSLLWWGPADPGDFVTIVDAGAPADARGDYKNAGDERVLWLKAPVEPGPKEIRYVTGGSKTVLGRVPITVLPIPVVLTAPEHAVLGSTISVRWSGPNNPHDYITVVPAGAADDGEEDHQETRQGSTLELNVPESSGDGEIRYVAGKDHRILGRRSLDITLPVTTLSVAPQVPAGSAITVKWIGPDHPGDRITIVPKGARDSAIGNSTTTAKGSPLTVLAPIDPGQVEVRYLTGRKGRVLARSEITVLPVTVKLDAPARAPANSVVNVDWEGPANHGDYLTIVPANDPASAGGKYDLQNGSPAEITTPKEAGPAEILYVSGAGGRALASRPITVTPVN